MRWVFWVSALLIFYTYAGYPMVLYFRSRWRPRPVRRAEILPSVSVVMAAHNEAAVLPQKLANLEHLDYPQDRLEVIVASDGSIDGTGEWLQQQPPGRLRAVILERRRGKAEALNQALALASGEIVLFTDARQELEADALRNLAANFADPNVGCVSGELMLGGVEDHSGAEGVGLYWRLEKKIRQLESASGSVVGATGALYAARRDLIPQLPPRTLLDDVYIPMHMARAGKRVLFDPRARAWDRAVPSGREFQRKVRTLTGNYQLIQLAPWLMSWRNPLLLEFISHKLLRLLVPFALLGLLAGALAVPGVFFKIAFGAQAAFYALAFLGLVKPGRGALRRLGEASLAFVLLNSAAVVAFLYFIVGKRQVWVR
jgi:biofilm PGA synthesis N-glycosyltransferase PgaC